MPSSCVCGVTSPELWGKEAWPPPALSFLLSRVNPSFGARCQARLFSLGGGKWRPGSHLQELRTASRAWPNSSLCPSTVPALPLLILPAVSHMAHVRSFTHTHTHTRTHTLRKGLVSHLNRLEALTVSPFSVLPFITPGVVQEKRLFLKGVRRDAFEIAFLRENWAVLF